ncbi:MAG TPA: GNAT family N-acetyltransferase [Candidatus Limnocylindria bacterium]|nr:GNAT family N-acetyltransferase [Candidatus Limnocylindria bacterium]
MSDDAFADYPKTVVLKDGGQVVLRPLHADEGAALRALLARAAPDERLVPAGDPIIVAWDGERAVAAAALERCVPEVARLRVAIDPAYRGQRLGTWLVLDAVHLAAGVGVERLEAAAHPGDAGYLGALERLDFVVDAARTSPSNVVLVKRLHRGWTDF